MRILLLSNRYPPSVQGGAEILAASIAGELERLGHEVWVLTSSYGFPGPQRDNRIIRTLRFVPADSSRWRTSPLHQADLSYRYYRRYHCQANAVKLQRSVAATKPDVLYVWEITGIGIHSILAALPALQIPTVFHLGSYWLPYAQSPDTAHSQWHVRGLKRRLIGKIPPPPWTSAIAVSAAVKNTYVQAGCDPDRIEVIHNSIDPRFMVSPAKQHATTSGRMDSRTIELLYAGRLCREKGALILLRSLALLNQEMRGVSGGLPRFHLTIVGAGEEDYLHVLQTYVREQRLTDVVTFRRQVPQPELIGFYDHADIAVVPSLWQEPFGLVVAEAMARQLPVIASDVGGIAEVIRPAVDGVLVPPGDEHALARALRRLLEDPGLRDRLGRAARETAQDRFSLIGHAARVAKHLQSSIEGQEAFSPAAPSAHVPPTSPSPKLHPTAAGQAQPVEGHLSATALALRRRLSRERVRSS